jgi:cytochrome b561
MSIALHWIVDLLILGPIVFFLGYMFGVHVGH